MSKLLLAPRSHRRRYSIPADSPRATLQRSIGLLNRDDEDFCTRLEIAPVPRHVNNDGRIGGDKDFLFSVFVFQRQRLPVNRGDNLFNVRVGHCALRLKIPWIVSFSSSAHGLGKDMYFQRALAAVSPRHRRDTRVREPYLVPRPLRYLAASPRAQERRSQAPLRSFCSWLS